MPSSVPSSVPSNAQPRSGPSGALSTLASYRLLASGLAFAAVAGTGAVLALRPSTYEAVAQVSVSPVSIDAAPPGIPVFRELGEPIRTIETAAALLHTRSAADLTAERLGGRWTSELVFRAVEVAPHGQTNLVDVIARTDDAEAAARVANEYLAAILEQRDTAVTAAATQALADFAKTPAPAGSGQNVEATLTQLRDIGDPTSTAVEKATAPRGRSGLSPLMVILLSIVAGLLVALSLLTALADRARGRSLPSAADVGHGALLGGSPSSNGRTYAPADNRPGNPYGPEGRSGSDTPS